jgi:four helix bundle protein
MLMSETSFEKLEVYRFAEQLCDRLWDIIITWNAFERDTIGKQLVRSVDSIGANIAEGSGRYSDTDNRRFIRIARGSLYETIHWLRRSYKRDLLSEEQKHIVANDIQNLTKLLAGYLRSLNKKIDAKQ